MKTIEEKACEYVANAPNRSMYDAYLAGAREAIASQWRSVEDKPQDGETVLIYEHYRSARTGRYVKHIIEFTYFDEYGFEIEERTHRRLKLKVKAWMPFPELPTT